MRLHKAETAFFAFVAVVCLAALFMVYAHQSLLDLTAASAPLGRDFERLSRMLLFSITLLAGTVGFGLLFIYPLIRRQVRSEGELRAMTHSLSQRSQTLEHAAVTDALTGMHNRRFFDDALREYLEEFRRIKRPVGLLILDLDHFKKVNDTHGHDVGDEVLREVASCLQAMTRYHDVVARLGGEEFAIVAPNMTEQALMGFAERLRAAIAGLSIAHGNMILKVTASVGLAVWNGKETAEEFYRRADRQLYEAKRSGRNRVRA